MPELAMSANQAPASPSTASITDAASHGALTALYTAALGHGPKERYLRRFAQFDAAGRTSPGWNWAASLCTLSWAGLRRLCVPALLYVAIVEGLLLLAWGPGRWLLSQEAHSPWPPLLALAALAWLLPGMYGDALLHTEIRKRIVTALTQTQSVAEACTFLGQSASSPKRLQRLVLANTAVALVAAAALYFWLSPGSARLPHGAMPASTAPTPHTEPELTAAQALELLKSAASERQEPGAEPAPAPAPDPAPVATPEHTPPDADMVVPPPQATLPTRPAATPIPPSSLPAAPLQTPNKPATATRASARSTPSAMPAEPVRAATVDTDKTAAALGTQPGYYLNAGLFAEEANARKVQAQLFNANLPAFRQPLETAQGQRIRVRVGPFRTRQEADSARSTLRGMALEAVVLIVKKDTVKTRRIEKTD